MDKPLVTFAIVSYNNYKYIFETLESLFAQDYPNVQLIISNDASQDFDEDALRRYIETHKTGNIQEVLIQNHEVNQGTVRNVEFCRAQAKGEYIMYMAADDALNGSDTLRRYIDEFDRLGEQAMVLCSEVAMCGQELDEVISQEPSVEGIRAIKNLSSEQLFARLSHTWTIPTTTCIYRSGVYDLVGPYDTDYFIMEDGPLFIKLARHGIKIHWVDDLVAAKHRGGGISHGNTLNLSESYRKYRYDEIIFYEKEILPYKARLQPADLKLMQEKWNYLSRAYFETFVLPNLHGKDKMKYILSNLPTVLKSMLRRTKERAVGWIEDNYLNQNMLVIAALSLLSYLLLRFGLVSFGANSSAWIQISLGLTLVFGGFSILLRCLRIVRHLWLTAKYIFTGK